MAMQGMGTAPARDPVKASGIDNKVAIATTAVPPVQMAKNNSQAAPATGAGNRGFSSANVLAGKIKV